MFFSSPRPENSCSKFELPSFVLFHQQSPLHCTRASSTSARRNTWVRSQSPLTMPEGTKRATSRLGALWRAVFKMWVHHHSGLRAQSQHWDRDARGRRCVYFESDNFPHPTLSIRPAWVYLEGTKRATSVSVQLPRLRQDLRTGSISRELLSELCSRRSGMFTYGGSTFGAAWKSDRTPVCKRAVLLCENLTHPQRTTANNSKTDDKSHNDG